MTVEYETLWCSRCAKPRTVQRESPHFSCQLPQCCGVRDWCETEAAAIALGETSQR